MNKAIDKEYEPVNKVLREHGYTEEEINEWYEKSNRASQGLVALRILAHYTKREETRDE